MTRSQVPVKVLSGVKAVSTTCNSTFAIKTNNTLWGWGIKTFSAGYDGTKLGNFNKNPLQNSHIRRCSNGFIQ